MKTECFVNPELLNVHLAAFFYFGLVFTCLFGFYLHSSAITAVFKLYLCAHRPALAEIETEVHTDVGQVETAMALVVSIVFRYLVAIETLTVKISAHHGLAISTNVET